MLTCAFRDCCCRCCRGTSTMIRLPPLTSGGQRTCRRNRCRFGQETSTTRCHTDARKHKIQQNLTKQRWSRMIHIRTRYSSTQRYHDTTAVVQRSVHVAPNHVLRVVAAWIMAIKSFHPIAHAVGQIVGPCKQPILVTSSYSGRLETSLLQQQYCCACRGSRANSSTPRSMSQPAPIFIPND